MGNNTTNALDFTITTINDRYSAINFNSIHANIGNIESLVLEVNPELSRESKLEVIRINQDPLNSEIDVNAAGTSVDITLCESDPLKPIIISKQDIDTIKDALAYLNDWVDNFTDGEDILEPDELNTTRKSTYPGSTRTYYGYGGSYGGGYGTSYAKPSEVANLDKEDFD